MNHLVYLKRLLLFLVLTFLLFGIWSCAPKTAGVSLPIDTTSVFSASGSQQAPQKWWLAFGDSQLNNYVDSALTSNFNLKTAWERFRESQAVVKRESSSFFPTLDASAQGEISQYQNQYIQNQSFQLGLSSGYEVDLWGRIKSQVDAERFRAEAGFFNYQTAALSLSAEIVRNYFQLIEAQNQLDIVSQQVKTNEHMLELIKARFGSGQIRSADILRQKQLLESTREEKIIAATRLQLLKNRLQVLLGGLPQEKLSFQDDTLPKLPPIPNTGVPADLIRRRPDVQSAYKLVLAADREVAAAISNQYPRFSISASASTSADKVEDLFADWGRSLGGSLLAPVFYGGRLKAEADRSKAFKNQRLYSYGQTILNAFKEVEDALLQEKRQHDKIQSIQKQLDLARQTYEQLRVEYFNGMGGYLDVLTALEEVQRLRRSLLAAHLQLLEYRVSLYRSLAGGFDTERTTTINNK